MISKRLPRPCKSPVFLVVDNEPLSPLSRPFGDGVAPQSKNHGDIEIGVVSLYDIPVDAVSPCLVLRPPQGCTGTNPLTVRS